MIDWHHRFYFMFFFAPAALGLWLTACKSEVRVATPEASRPGPYRSWRTYLGDLGVTHYSVLDQINRQNVGQLRVEWTYQTGDKRDNNRSQIQCNPLVIDGVLYATSPAMKVIALNAATGEMIWTFDPFNGQEDPPAAITRGVAYWQDGDDRRIFSTAEANLYALDAGTGQPVPGFGSNGVVDMRQGLDRDIGKLFYGSRTPGIVYKDLLILPTVVSEGPDKTAPGHVRTFDTRTGEVAWIFHTIPHPGEFGYDTWPPDAWKEAGGANNWAGCSLDEQRGLVFLSTGSPSFDFWGGDRIGQNLFGNSVLALKADTGERVWHFQTIHHDMWDRDIASPPNLVTILRDGKTVDAVAQATKGGDLFVFDRETGEPLYPIEEFEVPPSDLRGEKAWPTQPRPLKPPPFVRQQFAESDITDISPEAHDYVLKRYRSVRTGKRYIPPSIQGSLTHPGLDGGAEWGGAGYDPATGLLYINANQMPNIITMVDVTAKSGEKPSPGKQLYTIHCAACHGEVGAKKTQTHSPLLREILGRISLRSLTRAKAQQVIEKGQGFMPGFAHIGKMEIEALLDFMFRTGQESTPFSLPQEIEFTHTGYNWFVDQFGYPAIKPPWGTLTAIDLNRAEIRWQVPLGELPELTERGIPPTGTQNYGGPVVTAGRLLFIGASKDEKFRAFDKATGKILWETDLPAGGYATPCTYEIAGKQYVVIAAGGGKMGTKSGDSYVAFALPD